MDAGRLRDCGAGDQPDIVRIINDGASRYRGAIPADSWREPYMSGADLAAEVAAGVRFSGWEVENRLVGVMGVQRVADATLVRHAYVATAHQGQGVGGRLLAALKADAVGRVLVGTWAAATWAIGFYERNGFVLLPHDSVPRLLRTYWDVPERQIASSVVLELRSAECVAARA